MNIQKLAASVMAIGALAVLPLAANAAPVSLSFSPNAQTIGVGGTATVDIFAGVASGEILSNYSLLFNYNPAVVQLTSFSQYLEAFGGVDTLNNIIYGTGTVDFSVYSLLPSDADIDPLQGDSIKLATVTFSGLAAGTSILDFDFTDIFTYQCVGSNAEDVGCTTTPGSITVTGGNDGGNNVPEPLSGALVLAALGALAATRRKH